MILQEPLPMCAKHGMLIIKLVDANQKGAANEIHHENHTHSVASFFLRGWLRQERASGRNPEKGIL